VPQSSIPFVGRDDALKRLDAALALAAAGEGSVVLVYGEAGIGKTRLCEQAGQAHRSRGGLVLVGRATPEETAIGFGPIADALRAARRSEPPVWDAATTHADVLSAVVPELADAATGGERRYADRPVLFEALLDAVEESARAGQAVLWVLDDVHWADDASWHLIGYAARRVTAMSLVLAVSYREEEIGPASPRWTSLVQLKRDPHVLTVPLGRLGAADAERLVAALAPGLPPDLTGEIIERSAGTPLLIEALATMAASSGTLPELPDVALATVRERAARLSPAGRDLLDVAAVAGLAVEEQLLATLRPEASAAELIAAGLLNRDGEKYRFGHPLLRDAAQAEIPAARQRQLHEELAAMLTAGGQAGAERVAGHLEHAGQPQAAVAALEQAAAQAQQAADIGRGATLSLAAFRLARRHQQLKLRSAGLEMAAIRGLLLTRRWSELDPILRDTWSRRDRLPPADQEFLAVALGWHLFVMGKVTESWAHIQRQLSRPGQQPGPAGHTARLHNQAAAIAWYRGDPEAARHHAGALEAAQRTGDSEAAWWARHHRILARYQLTSDRQKAVGELRESAASARTLGLVDPEVNALWAIAGYTTTQQDVAAAMTAAARSGYTAIIDHLQVLSAAISILQGRADEAEALFVRAGPRIRLGEPCFAAWVDVSEALLYLHRGELREARRLLYGAAAATEAAQLHPHATYRAAALGWLAWEEGRWADVAASLQICLQGLRVITPAPPAAGVPYAGGTLASGMIFLPLHVDALMRLGRTAEAETLVSQLPAGDAGGRFWQASHAAAMFRLAPGPGLGAEAQSAAAAAPWPWLSALSMLWQGEFLGDTEAAAGSMMLFEDISAPLGAGRADRVLSRMGIRQPVRKNAGPLSERETEVAQLVAEGLSNPAIAARLYLSRPTVASHVTHILTKLGFSSRAQIAAWVAGQRTGSQA
jgi:DNA-binding CsgD family transcriptional regulator